MAIFTVGSTLIQSGAERRGAAADPPDTVTAASVQLADTDSVWDTTAGNILAWGVQQSRGDGTFANDGTDAWLVGPLADVFGARARDGTMPQLLVSRMIRDPNNPGPEDNPNLIPGPIAPAGVKVRLAIRVDHNIRLGAEIRTNADVA